MKKYTIIAASLAFVFAGVGFGYFTKQSVGDYKPRVSHFEAAETEENEEQEAKGMLEFFKEVRMNPATGTISAEDYQLALKGLRNISALRGGFPLTWDEVGPDNVGGRTRAILVDNQDPTGKTIYAGGVSGGLWVSKSAGVSWQKVNDMQENLIISSLCQTPNGDIYYGTGEDGFYFASGQGQGGGFFGGGVFKSTDGGKTFSRLASTNPNGSGGSKWLSVQCLASHPTKNRVYACTANGFFVSDDGGNNWTKPSGTGAPGNALMQEVKVDKNGIIYVSSSSALWRTDDDCQTFTNITPKAGNTSGGAFTGSNRIAIGVGYSNTDYVYIQVADKSDRLAGIFQSTDKGATWTRIATRAQNGVDFDPLASTASAQGVFDNVIAVDPTNENRIFAAGVEWWEWLNPAVYPNNPNAGWRQTTSGFTSKFNPLYLHSDVHSIVFDVNHGTPYTTYIGSDGGITKSSNGCVTFNYCNRGYNVTQFYGLGVNPLSKDLGWERKVFGGTQDNSCVLITGRGNTPQNSVTISGGDGFQCEGSQIFPEIMFYGSQNGNYLRSGNGGIDAQRVYDCRTIWQMDKTYGYGSANKCDDKTSNFINYFNVPMVLRENWADSSSLMAICANRQDGTGGAIIITYDGTNLKKPSGTLWYNLYESGAYFSKLEISFDMKSIYAASGSQVIKITGFDTINYPQDTKDSSWKVDRSSISVTNIGSFAGRTVTSIHEDKNNAQHLVVTLGNYGSTDHVYETIDGGATWKNISGSNLLTFPVYDAAISYDNPKVIVVATEFGMFATNDGGNTWTEQNNGMARVPVLQIKQFEDKPWEGPTMYIATHGRGIFKSTTLRTGVTKGNDKTFKAQLSVFPNPSVDFAVLEYQTRSAGSALVRVIDMKGNLVYTADFVQPIPGEQRITLNTASYASGNYIIYLKTADGEQYQKLSVVK